MDKRLDCMSVQRRWQVLRQYPCMSDELMDVDAATSSSRVVHIKDLAMPRLRRCPFDIDTIDWRRSEHLGTGVDGVVYRVYFGDKGPFVLKIFWIPELNTHSIVYSAVHRECQNAALLQMLRAVMNQATEAAEAADAKANVAATYGNQNPTTDDITAETTAGRTDCASANTLLRQEQDQKQGQEQKAEQRPETGNGPEPGARRPRPTIWPQVYPHPLDFYSAYDNLFSFSDECRLYMEDEQKKKKKDKIDKVDMFDTNNGGTGEKAVAGVATKDTAEVVQSNPNQRASQQHPGHQPGLRPGHRTAEQFTAQQAALQLLCNQELISLTSMPRFAKCYGWLKCNVHELYERMPRFMRVWEHYVDHKTHRRFDVSCHEYYGIVYEYIATEEGDNEEDKKDKEGPFMAGKRTGEDKSNATTAVPTNPVRRYNLRSSVRTETRSSTATAKINDKNVPCTTAGGKTNKSTHTKTIKTPAIVGRQGNGEEKKKATELIGKGDFAWRYSSQKEYSQYKAAQETATRARTAADAVKYCDRVQAAVDFLWLAGFDFADQPLARNWKTGVLVDHCDIIGPYSPGWQRLLTDTKWSVDWVLTPDVGKIEK